jgi:hypothetical protein
MLPAENSVSKLLIIPEFSNVDYTKGLNARSEETFYHNISGIRGEFRVT